MSLGTDRNGRPPLAPTMSVPVTNIWPLLWSRIFVSSETAQSAEAAELSKLTFS